MVNLAAVTGSWRALLHRMETEPPVQAPPARREPVPNVPFAPRAVARIRLVRRAVAVPASDAS